MKRPHPVHPGEFLRGYLAAKSLPIGVVAEKMGFSRQALYKVLRGVSRITPEMAIAIEDTVGGGALFWLRLQAQYDVAEARLAAKLKRD